MENVGSLREFLQCCKIDTIIFERVNWLRFKWQFEYLFIFYILRLCAWFLVTVTSTAKQSDKRLKINFFLWSAFKFRKEKFCQISLRKETTASFQIISILQYIIVC